MSNHNCLSENKRTVKTYTKFNNWSMMTFKLNSMRYIIYHLCSNIKQEKLANR